MIAKLLEVMENNEIDIRCEINAVLNACGETDHCDDYNSCNECKAESLKVIERLREEELKQSKALDKLNKIEEIIHKLRGDVPDEEHFNSVNDYVKLMNYVEEINKVLGER